uniref:RanBP2-type domain-containing protein n=1 Tax=Anopheles melas TaxID=34690 RepID=A0A182TN40_9DIPT
KAATPAATKKQQEDSSSEDSSSEEETTKKPVVAAVKTPAKAAAAVKTPAKTATPTAAAKKAAESSDDSSDDSSEEESTAKKPAQAATPKAAAPATKTPAKAPATAAAKKADSSDDSSDDSSEEESKLTAVKKNPAQAATPKATAPAKKQQEESSSEEDSSEEETTVKKAAVAPTNGVAAAKRKAESSDDSDSSEEENVKPAAKKPAVYDTPPNKKTFANQNGSASSGFGSGRKSQSDGSKEINRFRRIKPEEIQIDERLMDNSYEAKPESINPPKVEQNAETKPAADDKKPNERRGQWKCTGCSAINFAVRRICPSCKVARTTWKCKECYEQNEVKDLENDKCKVCDSVAPYVTARNMNERTGRWTCALCNATNKEEFDVCFCAKQSTTTIEYDDGSGSGPKRIKTIKFPMMPGDWNCPDCQKHNFAKKLKCRNAQGAYGERANRILKFTKGKSFRHEKTKKKRSGYLGGLIDKSVNSIKFQD